MKILQTLLFVFITSWSIGQGLPEFVSANIEKRIEYQINPSIAIGIVDESGERVYTFGKRSANGVNADEHSIYEIGSISKVFTAILLADQVLKGNMSVDDPIAMYLPDHVDVPMRNGKHITLGHLSDHTSSLPRMPDNFTPSDPSNPYADYTPEQLYACLSSLKLEREIGSEYEYSNLGQGLLGHILELKTGKSYEELLRDVITEPLGMNETRVAFSEHMKNNLAIGHSGGQETANWDIATLTGAGAIRSSTYDMLKFLAANLGLKKSALNEAMNMTHVARHDKAGNASVGLGWHVRIDHENDQEYITHGGATGGYRAFAAINKKKKLGVVVLTNSTNDADDIGRFLMGASDEIDDVKPSFATLFSDELEQKGLEAAMKKYAMIKKMSPDKYNFDESTINRLGYNYLNQFKYDEALAIFEINIEQHPDAFNTYDSYAEALMEKSIANYKKSIELNPANQNGFDMLAKMGVEMDVDEIVIDDKILNSYVGSYQLAPTFLIEISKEDDQLFAQATGQQKFPIFPKSETRFYLKVVEAQIEFYTNDEGVVESLTLFQGGQEMPGSKIE